MNNGLTDEQTASFLDLCKMANDIQLKAMINRLQQERADRYQMEKRRIEVLEGEK